MVIGILIDVSLLGIVTLDSNKVTTLIYEPILQSPSFVFVLDIELNKTRWDKISTIINQMVTVKCN